jgi:ubiquinone/menaquinone biosynthesis C-methylase UbiE
MRGRRLDDASAFIVVNVAMLIINMDKAKGRIIAEVQGVLRPGGRYARARTRNPTRLPRRCASRWLVPSR